MKHLVLAGLALFVGAFAAFASTDVYDLDPPSLIDVERSALMVTLDEPPIEFASDHADAVTQLENAMDIGHIEGATRIVGKSQGYLGLPLRDDVRECNVAGWVPTMTSAWFPSPDELAALNAGAAIHVSLDGVTPPPMIVSVGPVPDKI